MNKYIKEYLLGHNKLQVNNFGIFELIYKSAEIHPILHTVTAPGRYVVFRENTVNDTTELSDFVASKENITIEQANEFINQWVKEIKDTIALKKDYQLGSLGKFFSNAMGRMEFVPSLDTDISTESFGLEEFTIPVKSPVRIKEEKRVEVPIILKPDNSPEKKEEKTEEIKEEKPKQEIKVQEDNSLENIETDKEKKPKRGRIAFLIILFLLLFMALGIGIAYFIYPETVKPYMEKLHLLKSEQKNDTKEFPQDNDEDNFISENENNTPEQSTDLQENKTEDTVLPAKKEENIVKTGNFYIIIGSFQQETNAENFLIAKQKEYNNVLNLGKGQNSELYMVGLGPYNTKEEAENQIRNGKAGWWIYKK